MRDVGGDVYKMRDVGGVVYKMRDGADVYKMRDVNSPDNKGMEEGWRILRRHWSHFYQ